MNAYVLIESCNSPAKQKHASYFCIRAKSVSSSSEGLNGKESELDEMSLVKVLKWRGDESCVNSRSPN